jgi:hypothetical protein
LIEEMLQGYPKRSWAPVIVVAVVSFAVGVPFFVGHYWHATFLTMTPYILFGASVQSFVCALIGCFFYKILAVDTNGWFSSILCTGIMLFIYIHHW